MILRGITTKGTPYIFDVSECPVLLNKSTVALVNKRFSPLLIANTIVVGNEENGIFEGDYVVSSVDHKYIGNIIYDKGFKILLNGTDEFVSIESVGPFYTLVNSNFYKQDIYSYHREIKFKCNEYVFDISSLICVDGDKLIIYNSTGKANYLRDIKYCTGIDCNGYPIAYGDALNGGIIVCRYNKPYVKYGDDYTEVSV